MSVEITIVTPTHNRPEMLARAIKSVRAQTLPRWEMIVVDDASSPPAIIPKPLMDPRIRLLRNEANAGAARSYNRGIREARGDLIAILDDDDELRPEFARRTVETLKRHPEADFAWCSIQTVEYGGVHSVARSCDRIFSNNFENDEHMFGDVVSIGNGFGFTVRAQCYHRVGLYDPAFTVTEDAEFLYRLIAAGCRPVVISDVLVTVHNHGGPRPTDGRMDAVRADQCEQILERHRGFIDQHPILAAQLRNHIARLKSASVSAVEARPA